MQINVDVILLNILLQKLLQKLVDELHQQIYVKSVKGAVMVFKRQGSVRKSGKGKVRISLLTIY